MLLLFLFICASHSWGIWGFDTACGWTRQNALNCFRKHIDTDHDDIITQSELDVAREKYMPRWMKVGQWLGSFVVNASTAKVLEDCDYDKDGIFTTDDWMHASKTCLPSEWAICLVKTVCDAASDPKKNAWW